VQTIIRNKAKLLQGLQDDIQKRRKILLDIAEYVLQQITPEKLLQGRLPKDLLKKHRRVVIIAIGKAARGMAQACIKELGGKPYKVLYADKGHPLPTIQSIRNAEKIVREAERLTADDLAIVLISGGGSAMFTLPADELSLHDLITTTRELIRSGATIDEINIVRKHLSQVKGGRLAALLEPATVHAFVISDVVGNDLSTIASGPLTPDNSTAQNALRILRKYKVQAPFKVLAHLQKPHSETPKKGAACFKKVRIEIIGDHTTVGMLAQKRAKYHKLRAKVYKNPITGEARKTANKLVQEHHSGLTIAVGETTVTCSGTGFGGRNQEFVLAALGKMQNGQTLLSIGTDGVDGMCPKKVAGAIADTKMLEQAKQHGLDLAAYLKNNDSYTFFKSVGGHIVTGPTGTNLGDLVLMMS